MTITVASRVFVFGSISLFLSTLSYASSFVIQPRNWEYKSHDIGFEVASARRDGNEDIVLENVKKATATKEPILLLNGFGVGSFHQHRLIPRLLEEGRGTGERTIYCMDYLGQGRSWTKDCQDGKSETEQGLQYSAET